MDCFKLYNSELRNESDKQTHIEATTAELKVVVIQEIERRYKGVKSDSSSVEQEARPIGETEVAKNERILHSFFSQWHQKNHPLLTSEEDFPRRDVVCPREHYCQQLR